MANKTIGQLTAKTTPSSADVFALEDTEDTKKINYDALADAILNKITSKNYTVAGSSQTLINAINTLNSKTTVMEEVSLHDGSSSGTAVATGTLEYTKCHNVNSVTIAFSCSNITLQSAAYITGANHMPSGFLVPVCIRTSGTSYFVGILQQIGENELIIRSGDMSSPSNPVLSFGSSGRIYLNLTWVG